MQKLIQNQHHVVHVGDITHVKVKKLVLFSPIPTNVISIFIQEQLLFLVQGQNQLANFTRHQASQ